MTLHRPRPFSIAFSLALLAALAGCHARQESSQRPTTEPAAAEVSGTFSIVAVDPESGICGAAVASKYPAVGKVVAYARGGVGAFCTQHWHNPAWGPVALDLLEKGQPPEQVIAQLLKDDKHRGKRQLAVIDAKGRAINRNPDDADPGGWWWGAMSGRHFACQGNTLNGPAVVTAMAKAFEETKGEGISLAAAVRVARPGAEGYWLDLRVDKHDDAVVELAKLYTDLSHNAKGTAWAGGKPPFKHPCPVRIPPKKPEEP